MVIGFFCLRRRGIYFAMLTLAFAQLLYFIAFHLADCDGRRRRPARHPAARRWGWGPGSTPSRPPLGFYYFAFVLVGLAVAALKRILDSPFGAVLRAIRENSSRAVACGYDVNRVKHLSFVFSACFAGLAGSLDALRLTVVPVESLYWTTSGQVVMMTLLGGAGTFFGPFVGRGHVPRPGGAAEPRPGVRGRSSSAPSSPRSSCSSPRGSGARSQEASMAVKVLELHHHGIRVGPSPADVKKAYGFYHDVLGLDADQGRPTIPTIDGYWMDVGGTAQIHLMGVDGASKFAQGPDKDPSRPHVALAVPDIQEAKAELDAHGRGLLGDHGRRRPAVAADLHVRPVRQHDRAAPGRHLPLHHRPIASPSAA